MKTFAALTAATTALIIAPASWADPGQNGPPGPEGNPNQPPAAPAPGPPATPPGNSGSNPHGGPPGITGTPPQSPPAAPESSTGSSGTSHPNPSPQGASHAASGSAAAGSTQPTEPSGEPQGPPAQTPVANGNDGEPGVDDNPGGGPDGRITICHSTGSATNPFVEITISVNGLNGHAGHHDGADIIPAPAGGCDAAPVPAASLGELFGGTDTGTVDSARSAGVSGTITSTRTGIGPSYHSANTHGAVLAESASGTAADDAAGTAAKAGPGAADAAGTADAPDNGQLPFTGMFLGGLALCGLLALGGGLVLRRAARASATSL